MKIVRALIAAVFAMILILPVSADEGEIYGSEDFGAYDILNVLPDEVRERLPQGDIFDGNSFSEKFSLAYFFSLLKSALVSALSPALKILCALLGLVILCSVLSALRKTLHEDSLAGVFEIASVLCIMLTLYTTVSSLCSTVGVYLTQLKNIVGAMVPVTIAIGTAGGNISASAVSGSAMMIGIAFVEFLASGGLYPILQICLGISVASGIGRGFELGALTKLIRGTFVWVLGFVSAAISAVMTFQTSIASRADSLSMRAIKFAASKTVPVVGGIASDAVATVAQSLSLVKGTVGWVGVIIIIVMTLPVIVNVILTRLGVLISQTAAEILGLDREGKVLGEMVGLLGFLAAVCVIAALMFVYALAVFAQSSTALV